MKASQFLNILYKRKHYVAQRRPSKASFFNLLKKERRDNPLRYIARHNTWHLIEKITRVRFLQQFDWGV